MKIKIPNAKFGNPNSMMNAQVNNPHEKDFPSTYYNYFEQIKKKLNFG